MPEIHETIDALCKNKGVTGAKMCADLGLSRSTLTELRKGRAKSLKIDTAARIADYFGVSVDYLLGKEAEVPREEGVVRPSLKSVARIEGNKITPEEDNAITAFVDYLLAGRNEDE